MFAFGRERTEIRNYKKYLDGARKAGIKVHFMRSIYLAFLFFMEHGFYAYSYFIGSYFVTREVNNSISGKIYTSGDVLACILGIVYGMFSLAIAMPNFKALNEGKVAGKLAFDIIDRTPEI